ncbi:hypothetical protein G5V59_14720 [Nocardioides sp. W3-2-3]|uniref:hypothetical protein n=1 Tax=Nocardioides convexus TaxID=2712224 RepID=UPI00241862D8|nr:hypothetical protein [Nocardioides convexus]NHA00785.1 hypothetical protein [Nocardioides convexus]
MTTRTCHVTLFAATLVLALGLAGCGDDPASESSPTASPSAEQADPAAKALAAAFGEMDAVAFTDEETGCLGDAVLEKAGADRLVEWKVLDASHETATMRDEPQAFVEVRTEALSTCVGLVDFGLRTMRSFSESAASTPAEKAKVADDDYWAALTACVERQIPEKDVLAAVLDEKASAAMQQRVEKISDGCEKEAAAG